MAIPASGVGIGASDRRRGDSEPGGTGFQFELLFPAPPPLPADEDAAGVQERRGELGEGAEPADGAGGDGVIGLTAGGAGAGPVLGAGIYRTCIRDSTSRCGAVDELALAGDRLDQIDLRVGEHRREDEPREPGAGADVGDPPRGRELGEAEAAEAVGDVDDPGALGLDHGARRGRIGGEQRDHRLELPPCGVGQLRLGERLGRVDRPEVRQVSRRSAARRRSGARARRPRCRSRRRFGP